MDRRCGIFGQAKPVYLVWIPACCSMAIGLSTPLLAFPAGSWQEMESVSRRYRDGVIHLFEFVTCWRLCVWKNLGSNRALRNLALRMTIMILNYLVHQIRDKLASNSGKAWLLRKCDNMEPVVTTAASSASLSQSRLMFEAEGTQRSKASVSHDML